MKSFKVPKRAYEKKRTLGGTMGLIVKNVQQLKLFQIIGNTEVNLTKVYMYKSLYNSTVKYCVGFEEKTLQ